MPKWGFSESPLVDGDRVIVCPGGASFLQVLDLNTGKVKMKSTGYEADPHYVSVMKHNVDGSIAIQLPAAKAWSALLWMIAASCGRDNSTGASVATIPTPIIKDNLRLPHPMVTA